MALIKHLQEREQVSEGVRAPEGRVINGWGEKHDHRLHRLYGNEYIFRRYSQPHYHGEIARVTLGPEYARVWDVGVLISAAIRRFNGPAKASPVGIDNDAVARSHASPRAHVRSAHWHTYWTGPRDAVFPLRRPVMRWIPPLPIGMDWKAELPTNIRVVGE